MSEGKESEDYDLDLFRNGSKSKTVDKGHEPKVVKIDYAGNGVKQDIAVRDVKTGNYTVWVDVGTNELQQYIVIEPGELEEIL